MTHYTCQHCGHKFWRAENRRPGQRVMCPKCRRVAFRYAKPLNPVAPPPVAHARLGEAEPS